MRPESAKLPDAQPARRTPHTLAAIVVARLREEIIAGELSGGEMVAEIPTANRLGVSRVPVREAISVLEREGLLVSEKRGRSSVRLLSPRDMEEISEARMLLEGES